MKRFSVLLLVLFMSGCTGFGIAFERLDFLTVFQMDRVFGLSDEQERLLKPAVIEYREWLRQEQFPKMIADLKKVDRLWRDNKQQEAIDILRSSSEDLQRISMQRAWPLLSPLLLTMDEKNVFNYLQYTSKRWDEWYADSESQQSKLDDRIEDLEDWFGQLNAEQNRWVEAQVKLLPNEQQIRLKNSQRKQQRFIDLGLADNLDGIEEWINDPASWDSDEYRRWQAQEDSDYKSLVNGVIATLSETQKKFAGERIRDWIEKLQDVVEA